MTDWPQKPIPAQDEDGDHSTQFPFPPAVIPDVLGPKGPKGGIDT